jgi:hypothetical protein
MKLLLRARLLNCSRRTEEKYVKPQEILSPDSDSNIISKQHDAIKGNPRNQIRAKQVQV